VNPNTSVRKIGRNALHWFFRYGVYKVFRVHDSVVNTPVEYLCHQRLLMAEAQQLL